MKLLIFRTDIKTKKKVKVMKPIFNSHPLINNCFVDITDIDNVLRVEVAENLKEHNIIDLTKTNGFCCEVLPD